MPKIHKNTEITLYLSNKEALWLKEVMQNPMGPEGSEDYSMRESFFNALPDLRELQAIQE